MLVTDVGYEIVSPIIHQHPLSFNISVGQQHSKDVTNIEIQSPTITNRHFKSLTPLSPNHLLK